MVVGRRSTDRALVWDPGKREQLGQAVRRHSGHVAQPRERFLLHDIVHRISAASFEEARGGNAVLPRLVQGDSVECANALPVEALQTSHLRC